MFNKYAPEPIELYDFDDDQLPREGRKVKVIVMFPSNEVKPWCVIVENWDNRLFGKGKRLYNAEFTEQEKKVITRYHAKIYRWYLVRGFPDYVSMSFKTFDLMNKAANFFASL